MKKKNIIIVVLVVVVVLIVLVGVIGFGNKVAKAPAVSNPAVTSTSSTAQATSTATSSAVSVVLSTTTAQKSYSGSSFSFNYPSSWSILSAKPFAMTNFNGQYKKNAVIPAGGIQLYVVTTTAYSSVANIMTTELMNANGVTTSDATVDGVACQKATYRVNYAPGATVQDVSLYCLRGTELWKIYFSYPAGDATEKTDLSTLDGVLSSMKFL
jgi:hypothetical protein